MRADRPSWLSWALLAGVHPQLEEPGAQGGIERRHLIVAVLRVHRGEAHPALGQAVLVEGARGEELQRRLLDVALGAVELLKEQDAGAVLGEDRGQRVAGAALLDDRQADKVGRLEQAQIKHREPDAEPLGSGAHNLALADAGRPLEQHRTARAVAKTKDRKDARTKRHRRQGDGDGTRGRFGRWRSARRHGLSGGLPAAGKALARRARCLGVIL